METKSGFDDVLVQKSSTAPSESGTVPAPDRDYFFIARTMNSRKLGTTEFVDRLKQDVLPVWQRLLDEKAIDNVRTVQKIGLLGLGADNAVDYEWDFFNIVQISADIEAEEVLNREMEAWKAAGFYDDADFDILTTELLMRRSGSGTALPFTSEQHDSMPSRFTTAVEYIYKLPGFEQAYRDFMRDVFGPVGRIMLKKGDAYSVVVTERVKVIQKDLSMPDWNDIHILVGDFENQNDGFFARAGEAVSEVLGKSQDAAGALKPAEKFRRKVLMSENEEIPDLCIGHW